MTVTLCLFRSLLLLNRRPRAHSSRPKGPFGLMWLSLPHFVYNSVRSSTQLPAPRASNSTGTRTQFNYIIVRRSLNLWNRMFNRHQAEVTVIQFRGHSLPVHHSVGYHGNYLVPFHQPISAHAISSPNCHWNVSLPSGASPWNSIFWGRVEGQNITSLRYEFTSEHHVWVYPDISSCAKHVLIVLFARFVGLEVSGRTATILLGVCYWIYFYKTHTQLSFIVNILSFSRRFVRNPHWANRQKY